MKTDRVLPIFPMIFFTLGLFTNAFTNIFEGWVTWLILSFGIVLYGLFYFWFMKEYARECK